MKTVKIYKRKKEKLNNYAKPDETIDETINRLLDEANLPTPYPDTNTIINISENTLLRLKSLKEDGESLDDVIMRALNQITDG